MKKLGILLIIAGAIFTFAIPKLAATFNNFEIGAYELLDGGSTLRAVELDLEPIDAPVTGTLIFNTLSAGARAGETTSFTYKISRDGQPIRTGNATHVSDGTAQSLVELPLFSMTQVEGGSHTFEIAFGDTVDVAVGNPELILRGRVEAPSEMTRYVGYGVMFLGWLLLIAGRKGRKKTAGKSAQTRGRTSSIGRAEPLPPVPERELPKAPELAKQPERKWGRDGADDK